MGNADSKLADPANPAAPESAPKTKFAAGRDANGNVSEEKKEAETGGSRKSKSKNPRTPKQKGGRVQDEGSTMMAGQIADQQVHVNIAMADLMAYLQVVANNSNHLPLTRRDDPELDRTVSTLTSEDYARKSAAFIPSDVRVIGGTFSRYGRVWDLPTTEVSTNIRKSASDDTAARCRQGTFT
jgi:murein DD-endopeptidase MepM/ murein hydrolase activator NlpD